VGNYGSLDLWYVVIDTSDPRSCGNRHSTRALTEKGIARARKWCVELNKAYGSTRDPEALQIVERWYWQKYTGRPCPPPGVPGKWLEEETQ
jgi:hypothetical protein